MIRLFQNKLNWEKVAQYQILSDKIITEYINYQLKDHIDLICKYQILSQQFIEEYKYMLDWELLIDNQNLSAKFIVDNVEEIKYFKDKMDYDTVD